MHRFLCSIKILNILIEKWASGIEDPISWNQNKLSNGKKQLYGINKNEYTFSPIQFTQNYPLSYILEEVIQSGVRETLRMPVCWLLYLS